jgi:predicted short-subunit dehydrogenase-like oxidoreductase (DUF2520 family)
MKIGLIGCGKVGTTLCYLLKKCNHLVGVYDINKQHEKRACRLLYIKKNVSLKKMCQMSDILLFATPDDKIVHAYRKARPFIRGKKYVVHFSGLLPADIFPKSPHIYRCAVHPFATFPRILIPPTRKKYPLCIEGDVKARRIVRKIFPRTYFSFRTITKKNKDIYHLIGVFSSNLVVGLLSAIYELTKTLHWTEKDFYEFVLPLVEETLNNVKKLTLKNALSGPLERGDIEVVERHLKTLKRKKQLLKIYKLLSRSSLKTLRRKKGTQNIARLLQQ